MPDYSLEMEYEGLVAGVDEVGRGPLAGPVVAGAVVFLRPPSEELISQLDDSKKLTVRRRERAFQALCDSEEICWALGAASVDEIDALNIGKACHLAMQRAVSRVRDQLGQWPEIALVDGKLAPSLPCPVRTVIGGVELRI